MPADKHGTKVTFLPDQEIFEETVYDYDILKIRLREMAFLTKDLKIILQDEREDKKRKSIPLRGRYQGVCHLLKQEQRPLYDNYLL